MTPTDRTDRTDTLPPLRHPERYFEWTAAEARAIDAWGRRLLAERDERIAALEAEVALHRGRADEQQRARQAETERANALRADAERLASDRASLRAALDNLRDQLAATGATVPCSPPEGTPESGVRTGLSLALALVSAAIDAARTPEADR